MPKQYLNPKELLPSRQYGFSQIVTAAGGQTVYLPGQVALDHVAQKTAAEWSAVRQDQRNDVNINHYHLTDGTLCYTLGGQEYSRFLAAISTNGAVFDSDRCFGYIFHCCTAQAATINETSDLF